MPAPATIDDGLAIPEERRAELIDGRIVYQGMPGPVHGSVQGQLAAAVNPYHRRRRGPEGPGGWWISLEVDMHIAGMGCRPDLGGWERVAGPGERVAAEPLPDVEVDLDAVFDFDEEPAAETA